MTAVTVVDEVGVGETWTMKEDAGGGRVAMLQVPRALAGLEGARQDSGGAQQDSRGPSRTPRRLAGLRGVQ